MGLAGHRMAIRTMDLVANDQCVDSFTPVYGRSRTFLRGRVTQNSVYASTSLST